MFDDKSNNARFGVEMQGSMSKDFAQGPAALAARFSRNSGIICQESAFPIQDVNAIADQTPLLAS